MNYSVAVKSVQKYAPSSKKFRQADALSTKSADERIIRNHVSTEQIHCVTNSGWKIKQHEKIFD